MAEPVRKGCLARLSFLAFLGLLGLFRLLPLRVSARIGAMKARVLFRFVPARLRYARGEIARVCGADRADSIQRANLNHYGVMLAELAHHRRIGREARSRFHHVDGHYYREAAAKGGVILLTGHIGNWELLAAGHSWRYGAMAALVKNVHNDYLNDWICDVRRSYQLDPIVASGTARKVSAYLREGGCVAMLMDQNTMENEAVWVPFLGRSAATQAGVATLAVRGQATVVPAMGYRVTPGRYVIRYFPPVALPGAEHPLRYRVYHGTAAYADALGGMIKKVPEQWLWLHKRWKQQPDQSTSAWRTGKELTNQERNESDKQEKES